MAEGRIYCGDPGCPGKHDTFNESCSDMAAREVKNYPGLDSFLTGEEPTQPVQPLKNEWQARDDDQKSGGRATQEMEAYKNKQPRRKTVSPSRKHGTHIVQ